MVVHHVEVDPVGAGRDDARTSSPRRAKSAERMARGDAVAAAHGADSRDHTLRGAKESTASGCLESPMANPRFSVQVAVARYLPEQSDPTQAYVFAYTMTIRNTGDIAAQLIAATGSSPTPRARCRRCAASASSATAAAQPDEQFEYTSWTRIAAPRGTMQGSYFCMTEDARNFEAHDRTVRAVDGAGAALRPGSGDLILALSRKREREHRLLSFPRGGNPGRRADARKAESPPRAVLSARPHRRRRSAARRGRDPRTWSTTR